MVGNPQLSKRQRRLLLVMTRARLTTLLRWPFYLKLSGRGEGIPDRLGHPDLYGHELDVYREDVYDLARFGYLQRIGSGPAGFMDDYFVTQKGIRYYRLSVLWKRFRVPFCLICVAVPAVLAFLVF
jgi:hypothetical protein